MPLVLAGKYDGKWPQGGITINGKLPNGQRKYQTHRKPPA